MQDLTEIDLNKFLVKCSGIALFTVAIIRIPSALSAIVQLLTILCVWPESYSNFEELDQLMKNMNMSLISKAVGDIASFVVLILIARWIMGYPKILRTWVNRSET